MMTDLEQRIKEKLLEDLIEKMSEKHGDRSPHKAMSVEVAAPSKEKLAEGLEKAKSVIGHEPDGDEMPMEHGEPDGDEASDEHRLMQLLAEEEDEEKDA